MIIIAGYSSTENTFRCTVWARNSVFSRNLFSVIDDHDFHRPLPRLQLKAQLLLNGGEDRSSLLVLWYWTIIRCPNELHFEFSSQTSLVHDQRSHVARQ